MPPFSGSPAKQPRMYVLGDAKDWKHGAGVLVIEGGAPAGPIRSTHRQRFMSTPSPGTKHARTVSVSETESALADAEKGPADAEKGRADAEKGRADAEKGRADAEKGRADAEKARADMFRWADEAVKERDSLREQLQKLQTLHDATVRHRNEEVAELHDLIKSQDRSIQGLYAQLHIAPPVANAALQQLGFVMERNMLVGITTDGVYTFFNDAIQEVRRYKLVFGMPAPIAGRYYMLRITPGQVDGYPVLCRCWEV